MKKLQCLICNKEYYNTKSFSSHIKKDHSITSNEYYDKFLKKDDLDGQCITCKKPTKFININAGYYRYCTKSCGAFGPNNVFKKQEIREKIKQTNLLKYGFEVASKNANIIEKNKKTCLRKYGVSTTFLNPETQKKIKEINKQKYGFENPFCNPKVQKNIQDILLKRYYGMGRKSAILNQKISNTIFKKYGVENYSKTFEFRKFAREQFILRVQDQLLNGEPLSPRIGFLERECFKTLEKEISYPITKECFIGYFPDGYIKELNLIIEFYENWHNSIWSLKRDIQRINDLKKHLECQVFIIHEKDWKENPQKVIEDFKKVCQQK